MCTWNIQYWTCAWCGKKDIETLVKITRCDEVEIAAGIAKGCDASRTGGCAGGNQILYPECLNQPGHERFCGSFSGRSECVVAYWASEREKGKTFHDLEGNEVNPY